MKEPYAEGIASHGDPESCADVCKNGGEALTGAHAGTVLSRENRYSWVPTLLSEAEGHAYRGRYCESPNDPSRSKTRRTRGTFLRENRETPVPPVADGGAGRIGKARGRDPMVHGAGESDSSIVPAKSPNKAAHAAAEAMEGRGLTKGNAGGQNVSRTQSRTNTSSALDRVREKAVRNKEEQFTALYHHVDIDRLRRAFHGLKKKAAPGVDGVTWEQYADRLEDNLHDLHARLQRGAYRASPTRRAYIAKADGRQRPLGIAVLEDKVVQAAVAEVLNAIYEADFLGFSYGFRPGRSQHNALDALATGIKRKKVNWVLDADIRGFFDAIDHGWLAKFVEHRVKDRRILRLIRKWLSAGVIEDGKWAECTDGTPQGATISPLLANIYLH